MNRQRGARVGACGRVVRILGLGGLWLAVAAGAGAQTLANAGFEAPYAAVESYATAVSGELAHGWTDFSYGTVKAVYSEQTAKTHGGKACQQIEVSSIGASDSGFQFGQRVTLEAGQRYTPGVWFRGTAGKRLDLTLMQPDSPWQVYEQSPLYLTGSWQYVSFPAHFAAKSVAEWLITAYGAVSFCVDDAALGRTAEAISPSWVIRPIRNDFGMHIRDYLASKGPNNLDLEGPFYPANSGSTAVTGQVGAHWMDNSVWTGNAVVAKYSALTASPHGGKQAQRIEATKVNGAVQVAQFVALKKGATYLSSIWIRATKGMQFNYGMRLWEAPYTYWGQAFGTGTGQWQKLTVKGTPTSGYQSALMVEATSAGTLDFDDVTLTDAGGKAVTLGTDWPSAPMGTWRLWDQYGTTGAFLEPEKGRWNFALLDRAVSDAEAHGVKILLTLGQTPAWASPTPALYSPYGSGASAAPTDLRDWTDYVTELGTRYKGRIRYWEIWNEPNDATFYTGTIAQLARMTNAAAAALKKIDSGNVVIGPSAYTVGWLSQFIAAGGEQNVDQIGYHQYSYLVAPEDDARVLADVRTVLSLTGLSAKPVWVTEGAAGTTATTDATAAMGLLARKFLVELLYGAGHFNWYSWGSATEYCLATTGSDGKTATAAGLALAQLESWLVGSTVRAVSASGGLWSVRLSSSEGTTEYIVWSQSGKKTWNAPKGFVATQRRTLTGAASSLGGPATIAVTPEPVLLVGSD